jgi:hypothetical protein
MGVLADCIDHLEAMVANDVENTSFQSFFKGFGGGVSVLSIAKSLLGVFVEGEGVYSLGLNSAINDSFIFFQRIKQIININLFLREFIKFLYIFV